MKAAILRIGFGLWVLSSALGSSLVAQTADGETSAAIPGGLASENRTYVSAGPGLAFYEGDLGWTINIGALTQLGDFSNVFWGADIAFNFWSVSNPPGTVGTYSSGATGIQLLPTILYRFEIPNARNIHPYIGLSVGPNIYLGRVTTATVAGETTDTDVDLLFEALIRPGFFTPLFGESSSLNVEAKLGVLRADFIFLPSASAVFVL